VTEAQRAEIIGELGLCKLMLRKYRDAAEHLADSLSHRAALNPSLQQRLDNGRRQAERYVIRLVLAVNPSDADVFLDGVLVKQHAASHELFLDPGIHTVRAQMDSYGDAVATFGGAPGEQRTLSLQLHPATQAGASVSTVPRASHGTAEREDGGTADTIRIGGLALMGAAAVAGGVALGWSLAVNGDIVERRAELQRKGWPSDMCLRPSAPDECSALRQREARRDILAGVGVAGLIASGGIGLATFTSFAIAQGEPTRDSNVRVVASVGQQSGVIVRGVW
jgi:hypothetical protein